MHFLYLFFVSLVAGMTYLHVRFTMKLSPKRRVRLSLLALFLSVVLFTFIYFYMLWAKVSSPAVSVIAWYAYTGIGVLSFLMTLLILNDGLLLIRFLFKKLKTPEADSVREPHRRLFLTQGAMFGLMGGTVLASGIGLFNAHKTPAVKEVIIPVTGLHPDLSGFSLVQITDIHLGPTLKGDFLEKIIPKINALSPDLVALTGDLVDGQVHDLGPHTLSLTGLKSTYGNYFVTGNHEYYFNATKWCRHMESIGFTVLNNGHRLIRHHDGKILLAGVTDLIAGRFVASHRSDPFKALENAPDAHVKILLAHQPKSVYDAAKAGFDIQISGHTHGGQFFPWNFIVGLDQPFLAGVYHYQNVFLSVSRGTGYWGPPMRLGSPSEITRLILHAV